MPVLLLLLFNFGSAGLRDQKFYTRLPLIIIRLRDCGTAGAMAAEKKAHQCVNYGSTEQ